MIIPFGFIDTKQEEISSITNFDLDFQNVINEAISIGAILPIIADQRLINDIFVKLKVDERWEGIKTIHYFKGTGDFLFQSINLKDPTGLKGTQVGEGDLIISSTGLQGDEINYFDVGINPAHTINDASLWFEIVSNTTGSTALIEAENSSNTCTKLLNASTFGYFNSDSSNRAVMSFNTVGTCTISRNASNVIAKAVNGVVTENETFSSVALPDTSYKLFKNGSNGRSNTKLGYFVVADSINGSELSVHDSMVNAPAVTTEGGIPSDGFTPLVLSGNYGTYDAPTTTFTFDKSTAGIVEGSVTDIVAKNNRYIMNEAIRYAVEENGATIFHIDSALDAFFEVETEDTGREGSYANSIQISYDNFHFKMMDDVWLRVQPNAYGYYALVAAWATTNVKVSEGHLMGDRYTHEYTTGNTGIQDNGIGLAFYGVIDGTMENTEASKFIGDGFLIRSTASRNADGSEVGGETYSKRVTIKNCLFDDNRRNGLAFTDVQVGVIDTCTFSNTGNGDYAVGEYGNVIDWRGVVPRHGIDFEAINGLEADGITLIKTELIEDIVVKNSLFPNNYGDIDYYKCERVEVFGCTFGAGSGNVASLDISIHDNTFLNDGDFEGSRALNIGQRIRANGYHYTRNYQVYNNTFIGYEKGVLIGGADHDVYDNTFTNCLESIYFRAEVEDSAVTNNIITSNVSGSNGIVMFAGGVNILDSTISLGTINVVGIGAELTGVSGLGLIGLTLDNITFSDNIEIVNSDNITVQNCTSPDITQSGSTNITLINNN